MIFNGHTPESVSKIDDVTMLNIQTMYADGMIGNSSILTVLGTLTAGIFNYIRPQNSKTHNMRDVIDRSYDYIFPPIPEKEKKDKVNNSLLAFISRAPGFTKGKLNNG